MSIKYSFFEIDKNIISLKTLKSGLFKSTDLSTRLAALCIIVYILSSINLIYPVHKSGSCLVPSDLSFTLLL